MLFKVWHGALYYMITISWPKLDTSVEFHQNWGLQHHSNDPRTFYNVKCGTILPTKTKSIWETLKDNSNLRVTRFGRIATIFLSSILIENKVKLDGFSMIELMNLVWDPSPWWKNVKASTTFWVSLVTRFSITPVFVLTKDTNRMAWSCRNPIHHSSNQNTKHHFKTKKQLFVISLNQFAILVYRYQQNFKWNHLNSSL